MSRIIGVREVIGGPVMMGAVSSFLERAQQMSYSGLAGYGSLQRGLDSNDGFSDLTNPEFYDLTEPGKVYEIKRVLRGLRQVWDLVEGPVSEEFWQHMRMDPPYEDHWDGATADEYVAAIGRYSRRFAGLWPQFEDNVLFLQLPVPYWGVDLAGGPQPSMPGLEMLWAAAQALLPSSIQMNQYGAWRDIGMFSSYPDGYVRLTKLGGPPDVAYGWIMADDSSWVAQRVPTMICCGSESLTQVDEQLLRHWKLLARADVADNDEEKRGKLADEIARLRYLHNQIAVSLSDLPIPPQPGDSPDCSVDADCPEGTYCFDGTCLNRSSLPTPPKDSPECFADADCLKGMYCFDGMCSEAQCLSDNECSDPDRYCSEFLLRCIPYNSVCEWDSDCEEGSVCYDGMCVSYSKLGDKAISRSAVVGIVVLGMMLAVAGYVVVKDLRAKRS